MHCGLCQGCPLSPLLFNLVAKSFTIVVNQFQDNGWLERISVLGLMEKISIRQYYAHDIVLFLHGSKRLSSKIQCCLMIFSLIFSLKINLHKSVVYDMG